MKINKTLAMLLMVAATCVVHTATARKIEGRIFDKQGNAIEVIFNVPFRFLSSEPNYQKMQYRIVYYDKANVKKVLKPDDASEISFVLYNQEIRMLSRPNTIGGIALFSTQTNIFLKLQIDGKLKLFNYYYTQQSGGMYNGSTWSGGHSYTVENFILQKDNSPLMQPRGISFKKDMTTYFSDCPPVASKIQERELRKGDLEVIVKMYNDNCGR